MSASVPVVLLTGFLGAGKTTLLNHLLVTGLNGRRLAVIVNDIGEIGVDGRLVRGAAGTVLELASGCICCSAGEEFGVTLDAVLADLAPEALLIETTGIANPAALLEILDDERLRLDTVVTVVDAENYMVYRRYARVLELQVRFADIIALNKADLADEATLLSAEEDVRATNARAVIVRAVRGRLDPRLLFGTLPTEYRDDLAAFVEGQRSAFAAANPDWAAAETPPVDDDSTHPRSGDHPTESYAERRARDAAAHPVEQHRGREDGHDPHHDHRRDRDDSLHGYHLERDGISTLELETGGPLALGPLQRLLAGLRGQGVYRAKGIVSLAGSPGVRHVANVIAGRYYLEELGAGHGPSQLVCIGKREEMRVAQIVRRWRACAAPVATGGETV